MSDLTRLSASLLREKIAAKKVSPVELTETVLARGVFHHSRSPVPGVSFSFDGEGGLGPRQKSRLCVQSATQPPLKITGTRSLIPL